MKNLEQPKIDVKKIQETANAAAEKAYLDTVSDYYTGYNSPYKKMITEELNKQKFSYPVTIPSLITTINKSLTLEVDKIANEVIANSFIPMVSSMLNGIDKQLNMSQFLKRVIEELDTDPETFEEYSFSFVKNNEYGWLNCELNTPESMYEFTLHKDGSVIEGVQKYQFLSMPTTKSPEGRYNQKMTIYKDDVKIEMPFTPGVLNDKVMRLVLQALISNCTITMDCQGFDHEWFSSEDCHC